MKMLSLAVLLGGVMALGATPSWFFNPAPQGEIYGRGTAKTLVKDKLDPEAHEAARREALSEIASQILSQVKTFSQTHETAGLKEGSFYLKDVQVQSCVDLCDARELNRAVEKSTYYLLLSVSKERLVNHYLGLLRSGVEEAISIHESSQALLSSDPKAAEKSFLQLRAQLADLQNYGRVLSALYGGSLDQMVPRLDKVPRLGDVDGQITRLKGNPRQSFEDLAEDIIRQFPPELQKPLSYELSYFEWLNTGFSSEWSVSFSIHLAGQLESRYGWNRVSWGKKPDLVLSGQLLPAGDRINILARVSGIRDQALITQLTPASVAYYGMDQIKPEKLDQKLADQKVLQDEAIQNGQLKVRVKFPQFENSPAVYRVGDEVNIFIRANKPCYITVINVEADGRWNVLEQNRRISADITNEWVPLFEGYQVTPPTGVEQLLVQASLDPLPTYHVVPERVNGGTKYISQGIDTELAKTRGLAAKAPETDEYTEFYLTWTVLGR